MKVFRWLYRRLPLSCALCFGMALGFIGGGSIMYSWGVRDAAHLHIQLDLPSAGNFRSPIGQIFGPVHDASELTDAVILGSQSHPDWVEVHLLLPKRHSDERILETVREPEYKLEL